MRIRAVVMACLLLVLGLAGGWRMPAINAAGGVEPGRPAIVKGAPSTLSSLTLTSASFPQGKSGFIAGTYGPEDAPTGFVEGTTNGGKTWHRLFTSSKDVLTALSFQNATYGLAIDRPSTPAPTSLANTQEHRLLETVDGGRRWRSIARVAGAITAAVFGPTGVPWLSTAGPCTKAVCPGSVEVMKPGAVVTWHAPGPVLALADHGQTMTAEVAAMRSGRLTVTLYKTTDGGRAWTSSGAIARYRWPLSTAAAWPLIGSLVWTSSQQAMSSIFSLPSCSMDGCGISGISKTENDGASWSSAPRVQIPCQFSPVLGADGESVAVSESVGLAACRGPETHVFLSRDGGTHFKALPSWPDTDWTQLGFDPERQLWAITAGSSGGALVMVRDGGRQWQQMFPAIKPTGTLAMVNADVAYAAGDQSAPNAVLKSVNGGRSWQVVGSLGPRTAASISLLNGHHLWIGAIPLQGENTTRAELLHKTATGYRLVPVRPSSSFDPTFDPIVRFFSSHRGVWINLSVNSCLKTCSVLGETTQNGGRTWTALTSANAPANIGSAAIVSWHTFIVVTSGTYGHPPQIFRTNNAGRTWEKLLTLPKNVDGAFDLSFPSALVGYIVVNDIAPPISSQSYDAVPEHAVLGILKTTDGGRKWTLHALPGTAEDWYPTVSFATTEDGLIAANDQVWKTSDGGRVWSEEGLG